MVQTNIKAIGEGKWKGMEIILVEEYKPTYGTVKVVYTNYFGNWPSYIAAQIPTIYHYVGEIEWNEFLDNFKGWRLLEAVDVHEEKITKILCSDMEEIDDVEVMGKA
ncbi:MAG: hypothetical protein MJ239_04350 [Bacilli bacterium]|nr:hypothetical protein [Bacilli bacterium]